MIEDHQSAFAAQVGAAGPGPPEPREQSEGDLQRSLHTSNHTRVYFQIVGDARRSSSRRFHELKTKGLVFYQVLQLQTYIRSRRLRLVVSHSTCPLLSPSPPRVQLSTRSGPPEINIHQMGLDLRTLVSLKINTRHQDTLALAHTDASDIRVPGRA